MQESLTKIADKLEKSLEKTKKMKNSTKDSCCFYKKSVKF